MKTPLVFSTRLIVIFKLIVCLNYFNPFEIKHTSCSPIHRQMGPKQLSTCFTCLTPFETKHNQRPVVSQFISEWLRIPTATKTHGFYFFQFVPESDTHKVPCAIRRCSDCNVHNWLVLLDPFIFQITCIAQIKIDQPQETNYFLM